jgi:ABC-2 type transport system ATP-binding protein
MPNPWWCMLPARLRPCAELRDDGAVLLRYHGNETSAEEVLAAVHAAGISIRDVKTGEADLEDVFLALTKSA